MNCTHHQIQTWRVADTYEPAMWSCTNCGQKFVPLTQQMIDNEALLRQARTAMQAAKQYHGVVLLSDPPQDAWKAHGVGDKLSAAINAISAGLPLGGNK